MNILWPFFNSTVLSADVTLRARTICMIFVFLVLLDGIWSSFFIINAYYPTTAASDEKYSNFETKLTELIKLCPQNATIILGGDVNAHVGNEHDWGHNNVTGKYGIGSVNVELTLLHVSKY